MKKYNIFIIKLIIILLIVLLFYKYVQRKYNIITKKIIYSNNNIYLKNILNNYVKENRINLEDLYKVVYDDEGYISNLILNANYLNNVLKSYSSELEMFLNNDSNKYYLSNYFDNFKLNNTTYYLLPLGYLLSGGKNFNMGPNIFFRYDFIYSIAINTRPELKPYGFNNTLFNLYIDISVDINTLMPYINKTNTYTYSYLISSNIINSSLKNALINSN